MAVPETNREVYSRNPLAEVIAQLRFPPILRIEAEPPAAFQEAVRDRYPSYRRAVSGGQLPPELPPHVRNLIQGMGAAAGHQHIFEAEDRQTIATLSRETLTFKTTRYSRWEQFREQFERIRTTFEQAYRPAHYTRLGLRYVNVIRRSKLELDGVPWAQLLNPSIGGELAAPELGESIDQVTRQTHCKLGGDNSFLWLRTGFAQPEPSDARNPRENCFLIDCDFHTHAPTEIQNVTATLATFNRASGNFFRWAILPRLRDALRPQPLG
jgi:uncharacterized protein (TIGR04255 family)